MNLPASATEFLDVFIGFEQWYSSHLTSLPANNSSTALAEASSTRQFTPDSHVTLPRIHVYGFSTADDPVQDMIQRVAKELRCEPSLILIDTNKNRNALRPCKKRKRNLVNLLCLNNIQFCE